MSTVRRKECCVWWDAWHGQRGGVVVNKTHSCHVCAIPAPRFLVLVCDLENCGATNWDKENKRRNVIFQHMLDVSMASKIGIPNRKLTIQVWNLRESQKSTKSVYREKEWTSLIKFWCPIH